MYNNTEAYLQDKLEAERSAHAGLRVRFVHQQRQYDKIGQAVNFLPENGPLRKLRSCMGRAAARNLAKVRIARPKTRALSNCRANTALAIGTLVPSSRNPTTGPFVSEMLYPDHL